MYYKFNEYTGFGGFFGVEPWFRIDGFLYFDDTPTYRDSVYGYGELTDDLRSICRGYIVENLSQFIQYDRPFSD